MTLNGHNSKRRAAFWVAVAAFAMSFAGASSLSAVQPPPDENNVGRPDNPPPSDARRGRPFQPGDGSGRFGPGRRGPGRGPEFEPPIDEDGPRGVPPELADRIMEVLQERLPRLHERLERLRDRNPRLFDRAIRRLVPFFKEYMSLRQRAPELAETIVEEFQAEERIRELADEYRKAKDDANRQSQISGEIETLVRRQFELRQRRHSARLEEFARRIADQQQELQRRKEEFERASARQNELIQRIVEQIKSGRFPPDGPPNGPPPIGDRRPGPRGRGPNGPPEDGLDPPPPPQPPGDEGDHPPPPPGDDE